ncbi:hypothetical protein A2U01_0113292, partial [Trifolium medium]|nr:hypothetical protein [Trifolium medium]
VMEVSLRLVEHDEAYSERLEIVKCTKSMDWRQMRMTRILISNTMEWKD